ncbi:MAG: hypothetical protein IJS87_07110 [Rhodocyclaceae bacterium]|nr:hypothetical protein [Rhodocyclaceae bacterium]
MSFAPFRLTPALALLLAACVTINIYFPAAAAEKAADKIIDDIWQTAPGEDLPDQMPDPTQPEPAADKPSQQGDAQ